MSLFWTDGVERDNGQAKRERERQRETEREMGDIFVTRPPIGTAYNDEQENFSGCLLIEFCIVQSSFMCGRVSCPLSDSLTQTVSSMEFIP